MQGAKDAERRRSRGAAPEALVAPAAHALHLGLERSLRFPHTDPVVLELDELRGLAVPDLVERRYQRLMSYGNVLTDPADE